MIEVLPANDGSSYFVVKAKNGEVQATSETYSRPEDAVRGAEDLARTVLADVAEGRIDLWPGRPAVDVVD